MPYVIGIPVQGQPASSSLFGKAVRDAINDLDLRMAALEAYTTGKPIVRLIQIAAQSIADNTHTSLTFGTGATVVDTHNFHSESVNNTRITPTVAGWYSVSGGYATSGRTDFQSLQASIRVNGSNLAPDHKQGPNAINTTRSVTVGPLLMYFNGSTDYAEIAGYQDNAANAAANTSVSGSTSSVLQIDRKSVV